MTTETKQQDSQQRQTQWFAVMAFSAVALAAMVTNFNTDSIKDETREVKWAVSAISIALSMSTLSVVANQLLRDRFMNTNIETGMALLTFGFWTAVLPTIMNPSNQLAVNNYVSGITNLNLYFFSWIAFFISFLNFFACTSMSLRTLMDVVNDTTSDTKNRCARTSWAGLMLTSFVVMIAATRIYQDVNCDQSSGLVTFFDEVCDRTKFGVALGAISTVVAAIWLIASMFWMKGSFGTMVEFGLVVFLMAMWIVGVILLTFDEGKSPGSGIGNLYFFTWGSWCINVFMTMNSFQNFMNSSKSDDMDTTNAKPAMTDEPVAMEPAYTAGEKDEEVDA